MYLRQRTPFHRSDLSFQSVRTEADRVRIRPSSTMWILTLLMAMIPAIPAANWLMDRFAGRTGQLPEPFALLAAAAFVGLALLLLWLIQGQSMDIDEFGVEWRSLFWKRRLSWREIHDFGLSYAYWGQVRLYFAEERLETNGKGKKRMSGRRAVILIHIQNRNKTGKILDVCRKYTRIRPFLCSEEGKLTGILRDRS